MPESSVPCVSALANMALVGDFSGQQAEALPDVSGGPNVPLETTIRPALGDNELVLARELIGEYGDSLGVDLSFQGFEAELGGLPGDYAPPGGALLLAFLGEECAGCIAVRPLSGDVCEMKRLYVRPRWRGLGIGGRLIEAILGEARRAGYRAIRLDTLPSMTAARWIYEAIGFRAIAPYYPSPIPGTAFLELDLTGAIRKSS
jgi:ribosomal protein S18 acetylase RimI-like enzyme